MRRRRALPAILDGEAATVCGRARPPEPGDCAVLGRVSALGGASTELGRVREYSFWDVPGREGPGDAGKKPRASGDGSRSQDARGLPDVRGRGPPASTSKTPTPASRNMSPGRDTEGRAGYSAGGTFNTGLLFIRASRRGIAFARSWHENVVRPARGSRFASLTSDQQVFNNMMRKEREWPGIAAPRGAWVMDSWGKPLRLGALPLPLFIPLRDGLSLQ